MLPANVIRTELYIKDISERHHTEQYEMVKASPPTAVYRRGYNFYLAVMFDREFEVKKDHVRVIFKFGKKTDRVKRTKVSLGLKPGLKPSEIKPLQWGILLDRNDGNKSIILEIIIPPNALVGQWIGEIETNIRGKPEDRRTFPLPEALYVIFNPWVPDDGVYMENEEERNEYVLNETGKIWSGTTKNPKGNHWIFGQFDDVALKTAVYLLDKSGLEPAERSSPVLVARAISAIINADDDQGLLEEKLDGNYTGGISPHVWTGSASILDQYLNSAGVPVKYGQCWVYSAVVVTVCRALGIPCRSTTNYVSAHGIKRSLTVARHFDVLGNIVMNGPKIDSLDSCWTFHAWNEVWMTRPDLPPGYEGWQVIDATPQQQSEGKMRCGPASAVAVKLGNVGFSFDTPFVFSEINADLVHFVKDRDAETGLIRTSMNKYQVGKNIVTRKPGIIDERWNNDILDITSLYKYEAGSEEQRLALQSAISLVPENMEVYRPANKKQELFFELVDIDTIAFGTSFDVVLRIRNQGTEERTINVVMSANSIYYTGRYAYNLNILKSAYNVKPGHTKTIIMNVQPANYIDKLVDHGVIKIHAFASVEETKDVWSEEDDFTFSPPEMAIETKQFCKVGEIVNVHFSFQNPLSIALTDCIYMVEGPAVEKPKIFKLGDVQALDRVSITESFKAGRTGSRRIIARFTSNQIQNISATTTIDVS